MFKTPDILTKIPALDLLSDLIYIGKKVWNLIKNTRIKDTEKIDKQSSPQDINQIGIALSDIRAYTIQMSNPIINKVKNDITSYTEELLMILQDKSNIINHYTYKAFKRDITNLNNDIEQYWQNEIYKKISLDNIDCLNILKMPAGNRKQDAMQSFVSKILKDVAILYTAHISKSLAEIYNDFEINIEENLHNIEKVLHSYQQMNISLDNKDLVSYEQQIANANIKIFIYDKILNEWSDNNGIF